METKPLHNIAEIEQWVSEKLDDLKKLAAASTPTGRNKRNPSADGQPASANETEPSFAAIEAGCAWAEAEAMNSRMPEPTWYALAGIVGRCRDGTKLFHEISKVDPRYDETETQEKLEHAVAAAGPRTCSNIEEELGSEHCAACVFRGKIGSPVSLGFRPANAIGLMRENVFITDRRHYLELATGASVPFQSFNDKHRHLTGEDTPHYLLSSSKLTRKVDTIAYQPGSRERFGQDESGCSVINTWKPSPIVPVQGDCSTILDHLEKLIPDMAFRDHLLNCVSFLFQKPGVKISHMVLLHSTQGTGKSLFFKLLGMLLGDENFQVVESDQLGSRWTAGMANVQAVVVEEFKTFEQLETYNRLKPWLTDRWVRVEEKNIPLYDARTPDFFIGATNHDNPIKLEDGDRRFAFYTSPMQPQPPEYYTRLHAALSTEAGTFLHFLMNRDLSSFKPGAHPPMTEAKRDLIDRSRPIVTQEIVSMAGEEALPFWIDLVTVEDVRDAINGRLRKLPSNYQVMQGLRAIGARSLPNAVRIDLKQCRFWAWRNVDKWLEATPEEIRRYQTSMRERAAIAAATMPEE
ncbi:DUF5906 domain-containing protein [Mesorhizobium sp. LHD-90]|uniref:primase-helicase family protein n=1 Tax=Mesorhizobium sp. LHD-90 TaxID=3071414 RepID=UPI0027E140C1|nr:DUF5906 domain-containing protein [Mesorhizobium sp. LHD-90]MDQ6438173.1 DUF5906 domain-containing protein [Mesorhizobium sp. LHD-90]